MQVRKVFQGQRGPAGAQNMLTPQRPKSGDCSDTSVIEWWEI